VPEERARIQFRCVNEKHQEPRMPGPSDLLTVYEGKWAYCPYDIRAKGHDWQATGGLTVNEVRLIVDRERAAKRDSRR
jgi:hypothetical protein